MSLQNVTLPQSIIAVALLAATITAYKLFGEVPAAVALLVQTIGLFLMGRSAPAGQS